jgi:Na+-translocating ferredoxin:NAD+ oxidoreductase subunit G
MAKSQDNIIKNALILFAITIIAGTLLGLTYEVTKEPIVVQQKKQKDAALQSVLPEATFDLLEVDLTDYPMIQGVYEATIDGNVTGYAFELITKEGYGGDMVMVAGIAYDETVSGIDIIKHAETPGLGAKADEDSFKDLFIEKPTVTLEIVKGAANDEQEISAISGATITSRAVLNAVNSAIDYYTNEIGQVN